MIKGKFTEQKGKQICSYHSLHIKMKAKVKLLSRVQLCGPMNQSPPSSSPWNFPGKSTEVGCHLLLQAIFPTQGSNPGLLHWQADSLPLSHQRSPYIPIHTHLYVCACSHVCIHVYMCVCVCVCVLGSKFRCSKRNTKESLQPQNLTLVT